VRFSKDSLWQVFLVKMRTVFAVLFYIYSFKEVSNKNLKNIAKFMKNVATRSLNLT